MLAWGQTGLISKMALEMLIMRLMSQSHVGSVAALLWIALMALVFAEPAFAQGGGVGGGVGAVPEPTTWALMGLAAGGYGFRRWRDR